MKTATDTETAIVARCAALGLTKRQAQALADAEPFSCDLIDILGLNRDTLTALTSKRWLCMAAQTSSVSYHGVLTPETLLAALISGNAPSEYQAHLTHFLNEAPLQIVIMAIEQAALRSGVEIARIWRSVEQLNSRLQGRRFGRIGQSTCLAHIE